jgi:hypothetical protein
MHAQTHTVNKETLKIVNFSQDNDVKYRVFQKELYNFESL